MHRTHGSLETFKTETRTTDCTNAIPSLCFTENILDEWWSFPHHESHHLSMLSVRISDSLSNMNVSDNWLSCKLSHSTLHFLLNGFTLRRGKGKKSQVQQTGLLSLTGIHEELVPSYGLLWHFPELGICFFLLAFRAEISSSFQPSLCTELSQPLLCVLQCINPHNVYRFVLN